MKLSKKYIIIVVLVGIIIFSGGLCAGFLINNVLHEAVNAEKVYTDTKTYKCTSIVLIAKDDYSNKTSISSGDLEAEAREIAAILEIELLVENVIKKIDIQYPNAEYNLKLDQDSESVLYYVVASSDNEEDLQDICNLATALLCEEIENTTNNLDCKIIHNANEPICDD